MHRDRLRRFSLIFLLIFLAAGFCPALCTSASAQSVPPEVFNGLRYRLIGPFRGGRAIAAAGIPGDPATFYFGAVDGGVWKTPDAGVVWTPIFDNQPVASIGALAVATSDPKIIYAGTGESDIRSNLASGDGVYKSTDGGDTWQNVGLRDSRQISRIVIDPRNAEVVYVGVLGHAYGPNEERGVYKSSDGGAHWTKTLYESSEVGVSDLAIASGAPNILFAGTWNAHRPPWSTYAPINGPGAGIYRSQDEGHTWSRLTGRGLPEGDWGRVAVAVSTDGKRVYALLDAGEKSGLYRSDDSGDTWTLANTDSRLTSRAWYFGNITIDANNPDVFYVPNVALYRSEDGGKTISVVRGAPGGDDYHQIWVDPKNSLHMVLATDQGTSVSLDYGKTWSSWYNQPTAQLYHVVTDNRFPYTVYGAQQDSGSAAVPSRTDHALITPRDWFTASGSESGYIAPDPQNPDILYVSATYGGVARFDMRTSLSQDVTPWPAQTFGTDISVRKYRDPWTPVLVFSPVDRKSLYLGTQYVLKTTDGGLHWEKISPDLTGAVTGTKNDGQPTLDNAMQRGYGVVYTIAPSPVNAGLIWTGSDTGLIHLTRDGGKTWKKVTPNGIAPWSRISLIEASRFNAAEAYVAVDRHRLDDRTPYIYRTRDFGETWQGIAAGIPAPAFVRAVREDTVRKGLLFAGTEFGIYVSFDDGDHWQSLQLNLPISSVPDVAVHGDDLIVATHGRAFWILDNIASLRQAQDALAANGAWLYHPPTAVRVDNDIFPGTPLPPEEPTAKNPPNGAILDYYLKSPAQNVKLEIIDAQRNLTRTFSSSDKAPKIPAMPIADPWIPKPPRLETSAGMHRFVWDLRWGGGISIDDETDYGAPPGPRALPGNYEIRLTVDGKTFTQPLNVAMDPRASATPKELEDQLTLGHRIFVQALECRKIVAEANAVTKQLAGLQAKLEGHADLQAAVQNAKTTLKEILSGNEKDSHAMGLDTANSALVSTLRAVESSDRAIPAQVVEVFDEASAAMKAAADHWAAFKSTRLRELNEQLKQASLPPVPIAEIESDTEIFTD